MLGGAPGVQIRNISVTDNNLPGETLTSNHPFFIASSDVGNNDILEFIDNNNDGASDEEFMWEYTLTLNSTNVNIANDMGTVWYVDPSGNEFMIGDVGNTDQVTVNVIDPEVTVDVSPSTQNVIYGDDASFTVTVTNTGDVPLENITIVDSEGNANCEMTIASLAVGASESFNCTLPNITANVTLDFDVTAGGIGSSGSALCTVDAQTSATVTVVPLIDLELVKDVTPAVQNVGEDVTFTIDVTNQGPAPATGVTVGDLLPSGFTYVSSTGGYDEPTAEWVIGDLGIGETVSVTITATVNASGDYVNVAQVIAADQDDVDSTPNNDDGDQSEDDEDNAEVTPVPVIDLELDKQVDNQFPFVGDDITFTLELTNQGPSDATGVVVTDQLPSGFTFVSSNGNYNSATGAWNVGDLAVGQTVYLDITVNVLASGDWVNLAEVTAANEDDIDSTPNNGVDTDGDGIVQDDPQDEDDGDGLGVAPQAIIDLELTKTVTPTSATVGGTVTFELTIINQGPNNATGVLVEDILPDGYTFVNASADYDEATGIWDVGSLGVGNSEMIQIIATVNETGGHKNVAQVIAADQNDSDSTPNNDDGDQSEDDEDSAEVTIDVVIDLELDKAVSPTTADVGDQVTFTIDVTNQGPSTATGVSVQDILQDGFTFTGTNGTYDEVTGLWTIGTVGVGQTLSLEITATVNEDGAYTNDAEVFTANEDDIDSTPGNGTDNGEDDEDGVQLNVNCDITVELMNVLCDPGADLVQDDDDTYTFELLVTGTGIGTEWSTVVLGQTITGTYGQVQLFGPYNILQIGDITLQVFDSESADCSEYVVVEAPEPCSDQCQIIADYENVYCDDNGTPSDPTDDVFFFDIIITDYFNAGDGWTASVNGNVVVDFAGYISQVQGQNVGAAFGGFPIAGSTDYPVVNGLLEVLVSDDDDPNCNTTIFIPVPDPCSDDCGIILTEISTDCDPNGTLSDPTDDLFSVTIFVEGNNAGNNGWFTNTGQSGTYGSNVTITGLSIAAGPATITFTDVDDPTCTNTITVTPPAPCSDQCDITAEAVNIVCDDNGTPDNPLDDTYTFDVIVTGLNNPGNNGWTDGNGTTGDYGVAEAYGPFNIMNDPTILLTLTDIDDASCNFNLTVTAPASCSPVCAIMPNVSTSPYCDDNGTPADPSDDVYFFDVTVIGNSNASTMWNASGNTQQGPTSGAYTDPVTFGPYAPGTAVLINFEDSADPSCIGVISIGIPNETCSEQCQLTANIQPSDLCDDMGTPFDPSDDTWYFVVELDGMNTSGTWIDSEGNTGTALPSLQVYGPYPHQTEYVTITFTDSQDPNCSVSVTAQSPGPCSDECEVDVQIIEVICLDNGTPLDPSDDQYEAIVNVTPTGTFSNLGWRWKELPTGNYSAPIPYGQATIGVFPIGGGDVEVRITDAGNSGCSQDITIEAPAPCSEPCELMAQYINQVCDDNGTPFDPSDDTYSFELLVTNPVSSGNTWFATIQNGGNITGFFDVPLLIEDIPADEATVILGITDAHNLNCTISELIVPPTGPCSNDCAITASASDPICDNNGTTDDPSDDTYSFQLTVTAVNNAGSNWTATINGVNYNEPYGTITITGIPANTSLSIDDIAAANDPNCTAAIVAVQATGPCSTDCVITASASDPVCDDNNTPTDPTDDTYSFQLTVTAVNNAGSNWTATINGVNYNEPYGTITISGIPANTSLSIDDIAAANDPACSANVVNVQATGPCSDQCAITAVASAVCNDNGTPVGDTDDFYEISFTVTAVNATSASNEFEAFNGNVSLGIFTYGATHQITIPANGQAVVLEFVDVDDANCSDTVDLGVFTPCSTAVPCDISAQVIEMTTLCDDGGTLGDENDDTFTFEAVVTNLGIGSNWTAVDDTYGVTNTGTYGTPQLFGPYPAANYGDIITIIITDNDDPNCVTTIDIEIPQCNDCTITGMISNVICDDQGTSDPDDDTFTFDLFISGENVGATWTSTDSTLMNGTFGDTFTFGPYNINSYLNNNEDVVIHITPDANDNCELTLLVDPPLPCSDAPCGINVDISNILCDDNGTPNDPSDDTYTFQAVVNPGIGAFALAYVNGSTVPIVAMYGVPLTYGPFLIDDGDATVEWVDGADANCSITETITAPDPCSIPPACEISATLEVVDCIGNGAGTADDEVYVGLTVTAVNNVGPNDTWEIVSLGITGQYDTTYTFGPFPVGTTFDVTIS